MAYYKTQDGKGWYGFTPSDTTDLIEVTEQEWLEHLTTTRPVAKERNANDTRNG